MLSFPSVPCSAIINYFVIDDRNEHKKRLNTLSKKSLVSLIDELYGYDDVVDSIIAEYLDENVVQSADRVAELPINKLISSLHHKISFLVQNEEFVEYREAHALCTYLYSLLQAIADLAEFDLHEAMRALDLLLNNHGVILNRVDDSNGEVGDVFRNAVSLWLDIAADLRELEPESRNWVELILVMFEDNDFGCFDNLISHSEELLEEEELKQLAWRFESEAKKALKSSGNEGYSFEAARSCIGLRSVAEALRNMNLYEKATLIISPVPNTLLLENIIAYAMNINELDRAEYWLQ